MESTDNSESKDKEYDGPPVKISKGDDVDIRILVPYKGAGVIIGKGGDNIRRLREEFSAKIHLPNNYGPERILHMSGECQNLISILKETLPSIEDCNHDNDVDLRVLIHTSHAGIIIGQGGQQINELRKNCNLRILKVFPKPCPRSSDRVLKIVGRLSDVLETLQIAVNMIKDSPIKGTREDYDARNCDEILSKEYGGWGNPNGDFSLSNMMQMSGGDGRGGGRGKRHHDMAGLLSASGTQNSILGDDFGFSGLGSNMKRSSGLLPDFDSNSGMRDGHGILGSGGGDYMPHVGRMRSSFMSELSDYPIQRDVLSRGSARGHLAEDMDDMMFMNPYQSMGLLPDEDSRSNSTMRGSSAGLHGRSGGGLLSDEIEMPRQRMMVNSRSGGLSSVVGMAPAGNQYSQRLGILSPESDLRGMKRMLPHSNSGRAGDERISSASQMRRGTDQYSLLGAGNTGASNQFNPDALFQQVTTLISLPDHLIGPIMGNGGTRIKSIRQESGADITVSREKDPGKNERTVTIKGTQDQIQMAQDLIHLCVKNFMAQQ